MFSQALSLWKRHALHTFKPQPPNRSKGFYRLESGQGLVEYALLIIMVGVAVMALLIILGPTLANLFQNIVDHMIAVQ
jgi:pilus assembly protein Flp/PilA